MKLKHLLTIAALVVGGGSLMAQTDVTSTYITNADFSSTEGWTNYSGGGSEHSEGSGLIGTLNLNSRPSTTDASHLATEYCFGFSARWNGRYTYYQQVAENLQAGSYTLSYDVQDVNSNSTKYNMDNHFYVQVGDSKYSDSATEWMNAGASSWTTHTISFTLNETSNVTISLGYGNKENKGSNDCPALYVSHLKLELYPFATSSDYEALNTAISAVKGTTWGFDAGEYAPYNYVEVIQALATAQAIDQNANNLQATVQALTATLNTAMTANTDEVNAIWDPSFEHEYSTSGNVQPIAWTGTSGHNSATDVRWMWNVSKDAGLAATTSSKALFTKFGVFYGQQEGYTMPLNADTYYTLSFVYGGWSDCKKDGYVTMTGPSSEPLSLIPSTDLPLDAVDGNTNKDSWKNYQTFFKTNAEGNYVLGLRKKNENQQSQYVYGDFVLKTTTIDEATAYYNTVKADAENSYDAEANGGVEKTDFKNALDANMEGKTVAEIIEAAANLYTLRDAFVAATPKYDAYLAEKANAERIDASITASVSAPTTSAEADAALKTFLVNEYNYVKDNFNADAAATYGITIDQWTGTATSGGNADTPQTNSNEKWGTTATTYYEQGKNGWGSNAWTLNYTKTVTLPANTYVMKVAARASSGTTATLKATIGETTIAESLPNASSEGKGITTSGVASFDEGEFAKDGKGYGWQWRYLAFTLDVESEVTLQIDASANSVNQWCSFGDVSVLSNVTTEALETAYHNFEMKELGFEDGQYAPYNNVAVLKSYEDAKAIIEDGAVPSTQAEVDALTNALTNPNWVANDGDVDAIYNGTFAETGTGSNPKGWSRSNNGWGQQITGLTAETNGVNEGTTTAWYYNNNGAWEYGNEGVYTMPLAENQAYELTFKYSKHGNDWQSWMKASVVNSSNEVLAVAQFTGADNATNYVIAKAYFTTGDAGDYILSIEQNGNAHLTDVSLVKAENAELALNEGTTYEPVDRTYYETVAMTRKVVEGYNTVCLPFDLKAEQVAAVFGENAKVYAYSENSTDPNDVTVNFNTKEGNTIEANVPVLIGDATAVAVTEPKTINGVILKSGEAKVAGTNFDFVGTYAASTDIPAGDYFVSKGALYKSTGATTIKAFRAYLQAKTAGATVKMFIDGLETAISEINGDAAEQGAIFNLAGQRVEKAQKGIYIVNGKKVLVK